MWLQGVGEWGRGGEEAMQSLEGRAQILTMV